MIIRIPGWAWGLLAGLTAAAGLVVMVLAGQRRRRVGEFPDPLEEIPELYQETARQEVERAARVDAEAKVRQAEVAKVLANPDPDARTRDLAQLLDRWDP